MGAGARRSPARARAPASRRAAPAASGTPFCVWVQRAAALGGALALFSPYHPEIDGLAETRRRDSADGSGDPFDDGDGGD